MDRSHGFGSIASNFIRPVKTRFPFASGTQYLKLAAYNNSPDHSTKGTTSHLNVLCVLVGTRFQVLFHSPPGVLFTFPSRYCSSIGHQVVFRLGWWSTLVPTGFHVSGGTLDTRCQSSPSLTGLSPSAVGLPMPFSWIPLITMRVRTPRIIDPRFGLLRVRSPLLAESRLMSFPRPT